MGVADVNVALYDVDSVIPNLALMKLSAFHKARGNTVVPYAPIFCDTYDKVYASTVFDFSDKSDVDPLQMEVGGTGWDRTTTLPPEVDACSPDYSLYPGFRHSIGFTTRGCRFACKFCVVPEKEGQPYSTHTIDDIWVQRDSDFIILLDNDFFGNPEWRERIEELRDFGLKVNFSQGLNIRIISEEQAAALASVRFRNIHDTGSQVHFAWDRWRDERLIDRGIQRCLDAGIRPYQMAFYVLVGFDTTPEEDMHRVMKLRDLGCDPYVMPYSRKDPYQRAFARWVNHRAIFHSVSWNAYRSGMKRCVSDPDQLPMWTA